MLITISQTGLWLHGCVHFVKIYHSVISLLHFSENFILKSHNGLKETFSYKQEAKLNYKGEGQISSSLDG